MAEIQIGTRRIGPGHPVFLVAELSANHGQKLEQAIATIRAMKQAGADAVKVQTYTADTITIASDNEYFRIGGGTLWDGRTLHDLYREASMPWEWTRPLQAEARALGLEFFSSPFDATAVDFLEKLEVPAHKIASCELVDIPLIKKIAATGKPIIASTGMATQEEITEAILAARSAGNRQLALLKCTSAYPAPPEEANLRTMLDMAERYQVPVGLSDHTLGFTVPVAAVALGAAIVEKHFTLSRSLAGPDAAFSLEPEEFAAMAQAVRAAEQSLGAVRYGATASEEKSKTYRRSLFVVEDVRAGETFTAKNVRSIRPAHGLHTRNLAQVLGSKAACDIARGTPLRWELVKRAAAGKAPE